jgi:hypothetical protein
VPAMPELDDELLELELEDVLVELLELEEELDELLELELVSPPQAVNNAETITAKDILLKPDILSPINLCD